MDVDVDVDVDVLRRRTADGVDLRSCAHGLREYSSIEWRVILQLQRGFENYQAPRWGMQRVG